MFRNSGFVRMLTLKPVDPELLALIMTEVNSSVKQNKQLIRSKLTLVLFHIFKKNFLPLLILLSWTFAHVIW